MRPLPVPAARRPRASAPGMLLSLLLLLLPLALSPLARAAEDKQRVPRSEDSRKKSGSDADSKNDSDENNGFFDSCFQSCFDNCADSFFESLFSHPKPPPPPPPTAAQALAADSSLAAEPQVWSVSDHGWVLAATPGDSVVLWRDPAGPGQSDIEAGRLPDGAEVVVEEIHSLPNETELRVRPVNRVEPAGWITSAALAAAPAAQNIATPPPAPPAPAQAPRHRPIEPLPASWAIQLNLGGGFFGTKDLGEEYDNKGDGQAYAEAHYLRFERTAHLLWGAGIGYREAWGKPQYDYVTPLLIDEPHESHWIATDFDLLAGQRFWYANRTRFQWAAGPALFHVRENAEVRTYDAVTQEYLGSRQEKLDRWTGGAKARVGWGWQPARWVELGLQLDGYLMALNGRQQKSLTGDFVRSPLGGFDLALTLGFFGR